MHKYCMVYKFSHIQNRIEMSASIYEVQKVTAMC